MNIGEANAFYTLVRGISPDASSEAMHAALDAAALLAEKARKALDAGPSPEEVRAQVDRTLCVLVWGEDADVELCGPRVETVAPAGGVL